MANLDNSLHLVMAGPDETGWQKDLVELSKNLGIENRITWTGMLSGDLKWGAYHAAEANKNVTTSGLALVACESASRSPRVVVRVCMSRCVRLIIITPANNTRLFWVPHCK